MAGEDDRVVGGPDGGELGGTQCCSAGLFEVEHSMPGIGEQRDHVGGPALPSDSGSAVQLAEMVSIAQGVADVGVLAIRGPAVMNQDATQVFEHPHRVHGHRAPPLVEVIERERGGRYRMDPVQRCFDPQAGFVCVGDIRMGELAPELGEEGVEPFRPFVHHGHDRPGRYRYPVAVSQQLGDPLDRNVLADHQIADQCPQVRAIASRTGRLGREQRCRLVSAVAALALRTMLDGCHHNRREIEHLAPDLPGDRRVGKIIPTSLAVVRRVVDDLVGIGDRWEVLAQSTGLLAGLFTRTAAARLGRGLRVPVRGGRLRRVLRVHPEPRPQPCVVRRQDDVCSGQFVQPYTEFNDLGPQMLVLHRQLGVGRLPVGLGRGCVGRNSLRYARRCPRWWTVPLQGVNSYVNSPNTANPALVLIYSIGQAGTPAGQHVSTTEEAALTVCASGCLYPTIGVSCIKVPTRAVSAKIIAYGAKGGGGGPDAAGGVGAMLTATVPVTAADTLDLYPCLLYTSDAAAE